MNLYLIAGGVIVIAGVAYNIFKHKGGAGTRVSPPKPRFPIDGYALTTATEDAPIVRVIKPPAPWTPIKPEHADMSVGAIYQLEMQGGVDVLTMAQNTDVSKANNYWRN